jgi:hypothetical protein
MHFDSATNDPVADIIYKILCDHLGAAILTTETRRTWSYTEELRLFSANLRDLCASVVSFTMETRRTWSCAEELGLFSANLRDLYASVVIFTMEIRRTWSYPEELLLLFRDLCASVVKFYYRNFFC